ncbi:AEC family transporter [Clostridium formicaceticum]|uniref:Membrane transport protein n=1 Tax=Clostridium formicaceticum TaxID=1497 RepID=A0AAC9RK46_9CLOT|nr:AEC family transporter [Clostridium formicaceticum]AOY76597.1 transporter [Clostridium formicaceticum]ARE87017.1 Membrane transport protein [Clostridium formicaceticum]
MTVFLFILVNNIIPIFSLIALGYFLSKKFDLDINTLTKLNFYAFLPCFTFASLYTTKIPSDMVKVLMVTLLLILVNMLVVRFISQICHYDEGMKSAFTNSVLFYNTGNIGVPLVTLVFSSPPFVVNGETPYLSIALTAQIMVLVVQNITTNTFGFLNAGRVSADWKVCIYKVLKMPTIYAIPLAFLLKAIPYDVTQTPVWPAFEYAKNALVPIALITLGVQLSRTAFEFKNKDVYLATAIRLIVGPLLALLFIYLFDMEGIVAQVVMISSALPTGVNVALIAVECNNLPDFSSQTVMITTLSSAVSLAGVIYMARIFFPV